MPDNWTGFVTALTRDGKAEVVIHTDQPGIPGAPGAKVCDHCSECTARIQVEVLNAVGAVVGDRVSVAHSPGAVKKNLQNLLAIPFAGLLLGFGVGAVIFQPLAVDPTGALLSAAVGLIGGIVTGLLMQRRHRDKGLPFINRVLQSRPVTTGATFPSACCDPGSRQRCS